MLALALLMCPLSVRAGSQPYFLHNQSPLLQVFGLPAPEGGVLASRGVVKSRLALSLTNHADSGETATEAVVLDGQSYYADAIFRYGLAQRWEVGLELPYVAHRDGGLDNLIEGWHDAFGLTNGERQGPSNRLRLSYRHDGVTAIDLRNGGGGIGDVRVTGAYALLPSRDGRAVALRSTIKLPTGDEHRLRGSGATDIAVGLEATDPVTFASRSIEVSGQAGVLVLGDGELLPDQQKSTVPFASLGLKWRWTDAIDLRVQLAMQGEYFNSQLDELGGSTTSLAVGGAFRLRRLGLELDVAFIEDVISDATPDFGLYLSVRRSARATPP
jgi:hypothetical protein